MIKWYEVPLNIVEVRGRYEELTRRALNARSVQLLRKRGEYDPDEHSVLDAEPPTTEEWAEILAYGRVIARHYDHPANLDRAVRAGLTWRQVSEALGEDPGRARARYRVWAAGQRQLRADNPGGTVGMTAEEFAEALALADAPDPHDPGAAEDARAAAVRELEAARTDRQAADDRTWKGVLAARAAGAPVRRVAELAGISTDTVQRWTQAAIQGETAPSRARTPQAPPLNLDADTSFVLHSALREYAAQQRHEAEGSEFDARDELLSAEAAAGHRADADKCRQQAEIADRLLDQFDG